jgi:hypothetical protein
VDVGPAGEGSDAGDFGSWHLGRALASGRIETLEEKCLSGDDVFLS